MRLLVTRPEPDASELAAVLRSLGHDPVVEPLLSVEYMAGAAIEIGGATAIAATSRNGLRALAQDRQALAAAIKKPLYVVGRATEALAKSLGFSDVRSADGDAAALGILLARELGPSRGTVLHVSGLDQAGDIAGPLTSAGGTVRQAIIYRMVALERFSAFTLNQLQHGSIEGVLLMSPRTSKIYLELLRSSGPGVDLHAVWHFCLSEAVAAPLRRESFERISVARRPETQEVLALIAGVAAKSAQKS